jgi:hypothetical protein
MDVPQGFYAWIWMRKTAVSCQLPAVSHQDLGWQLPAQPHPQAFLKITPRDEVALYFSLVILSVVEGSAFAFRIFEKARLVGRGFIPGINTIHKFLKINPRDEVAINSRCLLSGA